jgi:hypothetical protein
MGVPFRLAGRLGFIQNIHLEKSNTTQEFFLTFIIRQQQISIPVLWGSQLDFKSGVSGSMLGLC